MTDTLRAKLSSRKYHLALLAMVMMFVLACFDKLTPTAAAAIVAAAGIYSHFNLKQKREAAAAVVVTELAP